MFRVIGKTHPGAVREHNEDAFFFDQEDGFAVVADGMGGYAAGEVASDIVVKSLTEIRPKAEGLVAALVECHNRIVEHGKVHPESKGMGSAAVAARFTPKQLSVCWAGDSRAYLFNPQSGLRAVSRDHSYVQWLLSQGQISESQARVHPDRNLVTQCLGINPPQPELTTVAWNQGDVLLLCSDGLTDELDDQRINEIMKSASDHQAALDQLVDCALNAGGKDNITVVLAENGGARDMLSITQSGAAAIANATPWLPIAIGVGAALLLLLIGAAFQLMN